MEKKNKRLSKAIFFTLLILLLLSAVIFFSLSIIFGEKFVLKYSPDGTLKDSTIQKINIMKYSFLFLALVIAALSAVMYHKSTTSINFIDRHKNIFINLLMLFFTITIFLIFTEVTLSFVVGDETSFTSAGPGSINFYKEHVMINNAGFRDYNFSEYKTNKTVRIAVVGDSISFGSGVANVNDTYPKLMEKRLNNNSKIKYEVYNFGIPGYDAKDEIEVVRNKVLKYNPDIVLIEYYENDIENIDPSLKGLENIDNIEIPYIGFWLREFSYTYYFAESRLNRIAENVGIKKKWLDTLNQTYSSEVNRKYNKQLYANMSKMLKAENITVVMVAFPVISDFKNYKFSMVNGFAKELATENKFYFVDLYDSFKNHTSEELSVNRYDYHPNELGHKLAADAIITKFINYKLI